MAIHSSDMMVLIKQTSRSHIPEDRNPDMPSHQDVTQGRRHMIIIGARGGVVVKALRYKPAGRGFDSR